MKLLALTLLFVAGLCLQLSAQITWQHTNGPEGGAYWSPCYNDQYTFFPDEFNLYRTADGLSWEKLPEGNLWPIAASNSIMVAQQGAGFNLYPQPVRFVVSHDNGESWQEGTMPPTNYQSFTELAVCSQGIFVSDGAEGKLFRSQDEGQSWGTISPPGLYSYDLWVFEDHLYAEWYSKIWRLDISGNGWELVSPDFGDQEYPMGMFISGSHILFSTSNYLWISNDNGISWTSKYIEYIGSDNFVQIGNRIYKDGGNTGILYCDNFDSNWHELPLINDYTSYSLAPAGGKLLCGSPYKGIYRLDPANNQLIPANEGLTSAVVMYLDASDTNLWAACGNGVFAYDLATKTWVDKALLPEANIEYYEQVSVSKSGKIAAYDWLTNKFYLSDNEGISWDTIYPFDNGGFGGWDYVREVNWLEDVLFIRGEFSDWRSMDFGQSWTQGTFPSDMVPFNGIYYGLRNNKFFRSDDQGITWNEFSVAGVEYPFSIYSTQDRLFALSQNANGGTTMYTSADGIHWSYSNDGLPQFDQIFGPFEDVDKGNVWNIAGKYFLYERSTGFFVSLDTCKTWLPIVGNRSEHMALVGSTFYAGSFGGGVVETGIPQNYGALSRGVVYKDDNNNGLQDVGEIALPNMQVNLKEPGAWWPFWFTTTQADGHYVLGSTPGLDDTLRVKANSIYIDQINPPLHVVNGAGNDRNFGIHFIQNVTDVSVTGYYGGRPRPGFDLNTYLYYANEGSLPANGIISLKLDPNLTFTDADPMPSAVFNSDSLVWDFSQLPLFAHHHIRIGSHIADTVLLGTLVKSRGHIVTDQPDFAPGNNHFALCDTVVGSYDPNEKRVEPADGLRPEEIAAGKELLYTIQFQNTGTYEAERVRITDQLDTALNLTTLRLVASSHEISGFRLQPGGLLEIVFDHIALPDSNANEAGSHGFVTIAIQRNKSYHPSFKIQNRAAIYFDFNEPILTNTVVTKILSTPVSTGEPISSVMQITSLNISPNPADAAFNVNTEGRQKGPGKLDIIDMTGKVCLQQPVSDLSQTIEVRNLRLSAGIYMVKTSGGDGVLTGKLTVQR